MRLKPSLFCLAALLTPPLAAQVPPFVDGPVFGGTKLFSEIMLPAGHASRLNSDKGFLAFGYAEGEQGADNFMSYLDDFSSNAPDKISAAISKLADFPWGLRSRAYGLAFSGSPYTVTLSREEMTSLWAKAQNAESVGFDTRRSVVDRLAITYISTGSKYWGSTFRVERRSFGGVYNELSAFSPEANLSRAKGLLDFDETQSRNITYAIDGFAGVEVADGLRLAIHVDRLASRRLWDVHERPQYRAGAQLDLGVMLQLTVESDLNQAMRMPFPVDQKTMAASLKIKANALITFAIGAERKTMDGLRTTKTGLNVWLKGKNFSLGAGFQFGQDKTPWGATWNIQ